LLLEQLQLLELLGHDLQELQNLRQQRLHGATPYAPGSALLEDGTYGCVA